MPPAKELHYFDRALRYPSPSLFATDQLVKRLLSPAAHNRLFRQRCCTEIQKAISLRDWEALRWCARYYSGACSDEWYLSLFEEAADRVCGEITPAYGILDREDVGRIHRLLPGLKIIFLLRNPIERAWSGVRFAWTHRQFSEIDDVLRIRAEVEQPGVALRGNYLRTLDIWEREFGSDQMFIGFFDDIVTRPAELLRELFTFLGVDSLRGTITHAQLRANRNRSKKAQMPETVRRYLAQTYLPELKELSHRFGGHAEQWRAEAAHAS